MRFHCTAGRATPTRPGYFRPDALRYRVVGIVTDSLLFPVLRCIDPVAQKTKRSSHDPTLTHRFGAAVRYYRQCIGLSQEELAWRAQMHRTYLADIERGRRNVSLTRVVALVYALRITLAEFFTALEQQFKAGAPALVKSRPRAKARGKDGGRTVR
jgi:DNA-binding XRE family transcriptional regulator